MQQSTQNRSTKCRHPQNQPKNPQKDHPLVDHHTHTHTSTSALRLIQTLLALNHPTTANQRHTATSNTIGTTTLNTSTLPSTSINTTALTGSHHRQTLQPIPIQPATLNQHHQLRLNRINPTINNNAPSHTLIQIQVRRHPTTHTVSAHLVSTDHHPETHRINTIATLSSHTQTIGQHSQHTRFVALATSIRSARYKQHAVSMVR